LLFLQDPAIVVEDLDKYSPGQRAVDADAFVKWPNSSLIPDDQLPQANDYMVGYVWPTKKTAFPDFWKKSTQDWWHNEIQLLHDELEFDGLWIDMNEPANFGTN
jgi:maltase-glucoamylase